MVPYCIEIAVTIIGPVYYSRVSTLIVKFLVTVGIHFLLWTRASSSVKSNRRQPRIERGGVNHKF